MALQPARPLLARLLCSNAPQQQVPVWTATVTGTFSFVDDTECGHLSFSFAYQKKGFLKFSKQPRTFCTEQMNQASKLLASWHGNLMESQTGRTSIPPGNSGIHDLDGNKFKQYENPLTWMSHFFASTNKAKKCWEFDFIRGFHFAPRAVLAMQSIVSQSWK